MFKILVADSLSPAGIAELESAQDVDLKVNPGMSEEEFAETIADFDAVIVRSKAKVTQAVLDAATNLQAVGRAGVGVDTIDVEHATKQGVIVMNAPDGNTISTAEHTFSLMVSTARPIPQANASVRERKWDRKKFMGVEMHGKTLTVLGMGRIGTEVARRAMAFGMKVVAYDPYLSASRARSLQVDLVEDLDEALKLADFVTMHMPLTSETENMIDARRLGLMKEGVRIVNCARGGLVNEAALADALKSGQVAAAALDVFTAEPPGDDFPLWECENAVFTPHLGASTDEAQESVGVEIAQTILNYLRDGTIRNAVNMPSLDKKTLDIIGPYLAFGKTLGTFISQVAPRRSEKLTISYQGKVSSADTTAITRMVLHGFLGQMHDERVNPINAMSYADSLGITVTEKKDAKGGEYTDMIGIVAELAGDEYSVEGTFFGNVARIVGINGRHVEARPEGYVVLMENRDRPGIVGMLGSAFGKHDVNIARMSLSRHEVGGRVLSVLNVDGEPPRELLDELLTFPDIYSVKVVNFG